MKDFSFDNIQKAANEVYRMKEQSKFSDEDLNRYKCNCRFEKDNPDSLSQNGKTCYIKNNSSDDDKMLILALILILAKNSDDKMLLFALLYLIM